MLVVDLCRVYDFSRTGKRGTAISPHGKTSQQIAIHPACLFTTGKAGISGA
jgi:hypothetical protein